MIKKSFLVEQKYEVHKATIGQVQRDNEVVLLKQIHFHEVCYSEVRLGWDG